MINKPNFEKIIENPNKNVYKFQSKETKRRALFMDNYIESNFGEGKFFAKLRTYSGNGVKISE